MPPVLAKIQKALRLNHEDSLLGVAFAWLLAPPLLTLLFFYLYTVTASNHVIDLQPRDIRHGFIGAGVGLALGVAVAIAVTILYPRLVEADARHDQHH